MPKSRSFKCPVHQKYARACASPGMRWGWLLSAMVSCVVVHASAELVNISGVYPHLAVTSSAGESGIGAVVPWADRLWAVTYSQHHPRGSDDKLYEITPDLEMIVRPESVGGTPANRFIHQATQQLIIGSHFIDKERNVRTLPLRVASGRMTGTAAHLTDPNRVYMYTMESGLYDVDARDLSVIVRYPDVQPRGDRFLHGYHGKGAYTGQGLLVVSNNGRRFDQHTPKGPAGVLATWDGTTVEENNGVFTDDHRANPSGDGPDPVDPQPHFMAGWNQVYLTQHCEVTGPGGIYGNPNPETDPIWSTGWDDKSILLRVMENREWNLWRLPRGSYSHDGSHGWHVEWPRIRQLDPQDPDSIYLMHMHGLFFDFPKTFSAANFAGLRPISAFFKMPLDYAMFEGRLVIAKNDASRFANPLVPRPQSNFWFGDLDTIKQAWGAPAGVGAVWKMDAVTAGQVSDPFLVHGFPQRTLHLRNDGDAAVELALEVSQGTPDWKEAMRWTVPANGYLPVLLSDLDAQWVRIKSHGVSSSLTAFFHMYSPYPHTAPHNEFNALADIDDNRPVSDGVLRLMPDTSLSLEFASARTDASPHRYHRIGSDIKLTDVVDQGAEAQLRRAAALQKGFRVDDASIYLLRDDMRYRLPRLHEGYEEPFASGWARGLREVVTERFLLNAHGTFYEVPRDNSGGVPKMRPLATHGKRITDFAPWRGLFVLTGVLDAAPASNQVVKNEDGSAALWLGEVDDLWRMGEPRGHGGPWKNTEVAANAASDPYLMFGYDRKELTLKATEATTITVEVDFLAENEWSPYKTFDLAAGETITYLFPEGFHAHWVRVRSSDATTATAQFKYGPAS